MADSFIGDALMGLGQGLTGQPYLTNFEKLKQDASQWRDQQAQLQITNAQAQQKLNIDQTTSNANLGMMAAFLHMSPDDLRSAINPSQMPPGSALPMNGVNGLPQAPGQAMLPTAPNGPQAPMVGTPPIAPGISPQDASTKMQTAIASSGMMPSFEGGKFSLKPSMGALPTDQVQSMAQQLVSGQLMPSELGGIRGSGKAQVLQAAQALDPTYNPAQADMNYAAQKMGVSSFTKNFANLQSFKSDFDKNAQMLLQYSNQLDRSKYPIINQAIIAGKQSIQGDPLATQYIQALNTVANGYAKLQNPSLSGQALSDAARSEASDLLNKFQSGVQVDALLNPKYGSMMRESQNRIDAAQETLNNLKSGNVTSNSSATKLQSLKDKYGLQ